MTENKKQKQKDQLHKYPKGMRIAVLLFLAALIIAADLWYLAGPDRAFSENENRVLQEAPKADLASVISGDYIMETNSCYRGDPVVLGYLPGFDIHITELYFEEPDIVFDSGDESSGTHSVRGSISLYNYGTGSFDELEPDQRSLGEEELSEYLSPDNMLTVRYADSGDPAGGRLDTALPIPYVIGEEN